MKLLYSSPQTEVLDFTCSGEILTFSGDNENYGFGPAIGEDED